jgi:hypothetical protein
VVGSMPCPGRPVHGLAQAEPLELRGEPTWKGHWLNKLDLGTAWSKSSVSILTLFTILSTDPSANFLYVSFPVYSLRRDHSKVSCGEINIPIALVAIETMAHCSCLGDVRLHKIGVRPQCRNMIVVRRQTVWLTGALAVKLT